MKTSFSLRLRGASLSILALGFCIGASASSNEPECRVVNGVTVIFAGGTSEQEKIKVIQSIRQHDILDFQPQGRWSVTSRGGTGAYGSPATVSFSFVPDGVNVPQQGLGTGPNVLNSNMNSRFGGNTQLWKDKFRQCFQRWDDLTGLSYVEEPDDGASLHSSAGVIGVRGDVRIAAIPMTNNNVLAYNFFPNTGDMVLNSNHNWAQSGGDYRFMRNVVMHEHGHGIGLAHVDPTNGTKLMEAFLNTNFDGPQDDDIQGGQWLYGDPLEINDTNSTRTDVGTIANGQVVQNLAIQRASDRDWFRIIVPSGFNLSITASPVGSTYLQGPQGGGTSSRNSRSIQNLRVSAYAQDGTTLLGTSDAAGIGLPEVLSNVSPPANGIVHVLIDPSTTANDIQRYTLTFNLTPAALEVPPASFTMVRGLVVSGGIAELQASDDQLLVLRPGIVFSTSEAPIQIEMVAISPENIPASMSFKVEFSANQANINQTIELYIPSLNVWEEVDSRIAPTTENTIEILLDPQPERFISNLDGQMKARISYKAAGPVFSYPWNARLDYVAWKITR